jgi:hypothetical protein
MIFREASCDSEARFTGLLNSRCAGAGAATCIGASVLASRPSVGVAELRKSPVKPKRPRFFDGGSMTSLAGTSREARWKQ